MLKIAVSLLVLIALVILLSSISIKFWGEKPEKILLRQEVVLQEGMTLSEFGKVNQLPNTVLKEALGLVSREDLQKRVSELGLSKAQILSRVNMALALEREHASKNWLKILVKFVLWVLFLGFVFFL